MKIEDYALVGDCQTAALVGRNGSIDWLCWPRFDSDACFAAILGDEGNGRWRIAPGTDTFDDQVETQRTYRGETLILETTFKSATGTVKLTDFMPVGSRHTHIVRTVQGLEGKTSMRLEMSLRFGYGKVVPWVTHFDGGVRCIAGPDLVVLRSGVETHGEGQQTVANFEVEAGEQLHFVLSYGNSAEPVPHEIDVDGALSRAQQAWSGWSARGTNVGPYAEAVRRSLLTLKALTYRKTGGVTAAATTSLPEALGGPRNWDYRYCWLRDSTFTLLALMNGGHFKEANEWRKWLARSIAGSPEQIQIMYAIDGERHLAEWEASWLAGYENSKPVRVGNAAAEQLQLDIYGEVFDAVFHAAGGHGSKVNAEHFPLLRALLEHLAEVWQKPDQGIWESRSGPKQHTYSKMMCWVAFDRAVRLAEQGSHEAPLEQWRSIRDEIHAQVCEKGYNKKMQAFTQEYGSEQLDASMLLMPLVGFLPATDERVRNTIERIEQKLMSHGLVMRYNTQKSPDGLPPGEGVFLACSFWMVSCLKMIGRAEDARRLFDHLLSLRNDVGLLSEEYDTHQLRQVGNFPQAFSHIALVNAAFDLIEPAGMQRKRHSHATSQAVNADQAHAAIADLDPHPSEENH